VDNYQIKGKAYLKDEIVDCSIYIEDERNRYLSENEVISQITEGGG
jgi:hypothetical protein